jgi:hypothetical protein
MKKGCLIAVGVVGLMVLAGIASIWILAARYDKRPKAPGEAELFAAEEFIRANGDSEAAGNTPEAIALATDFARDLRVSRQVLFTEGKAGSASISKGRFLTYCFLRNESAALIVHVPELRRYTDDAKLSMEEYAWTLAATSIASKHPEVKRMALGVKGVMNYSAIITGTVNKDDPQHGIEKRHPIVSTQPLWPFFETKPKQGDERSAGVNGQLPVRQP